jgi:hypothetical protein
MAGFQTIEADTRRGPRTATEPVVNFNGTNAQFRLNSLAVEQLGTPDKIEIMYDADTNRLAFVPSDSPVAVQLRRENAEAANRYFGFRTLAHKLGIDQKRGRATLVKDEATGYMVVNVADLAAFDIVKRGPRKAEGEDTEAAE